MNCSIFSSVNISFYLLDFLEFPWKQVTRVIMANLQIYFIFTLNLSSLELSKLVSRKKRVIAWEYHTQVTWSLECVYIGVHACCSQKQYDREPWNCSQLILQKLAWLNMIVNKLEIKAISRGYICTTSNTHGE